MPECQRLGWHDQLSSSWPALHGWAGRRRKGWEQMADSYTELGKQVDADGGLLVCRMEDLREIHGAGRLGSHVRDNMHAKLEAHGLGHLPEELPPYQEDVVRIYRRGGPIGRLVNAVQRPSSQGDQQLRQLGGGAAEEVLRRVRELVCD